MGPLMPAVGQTRRRPVSVRSSRAISRPGRSVKRAPQTRWPGIQIARGSAALHSMRMNRSWLLLFIGAVCIGVLDAGCGNGSNSSPSCNEPTQCVYGSQDAPICHQSCFIDAGACPSGQVCTGASACCGGVPANQCDSPLVMVCCPPSGC